MFHLLMVGGGEGVTAMLCELLEQVNSHVTAAHTGVEGGRTWTVYHEVTSCINRCYSNR